MLDDTRKIIEINRRYYERKEEFFRRLEELKRCTICDTTTDVMARKTLETEDEENLCFSCWKMMIAILPVIK